LRRKKPRHNAAHTEGLVVRFKKLPWFYIIVLLGVLSHAVMLNMQIVAGIESEKFFQTQGTIITARVVEHSSSENGRAKNSFYEVVVTYRYRVMGIEYTGNRATAGGGWFFSSEAVARKRAEELTARPEVAVYFDPKDHTKTLLERGTAERDVLGMLVTLPFIGVAAGLLTSRVTKERRLLLGLLTGIAAALVAGLVQWIVLSALIS
jgi:hypothetical protein